MHIVLDVRLYGNVHLVSGFGRRQWGMGDLEAEKWKCQRTWRWMRNIQTSWRGVGSCGTDEESDSACRFRLGSIVAESNETTNLFYEIVFRADHCCKGDCFEMRLAGCRYGSWQLADIGIARAMTERERFGLLIGARWRALTGDEQDLISIPRAFSKSLEARDEIVQRDVHRARRLGDCNCGDRVCAILQNPRIAQYSRAALSWNFGRRLETLRDFGIFDPMSSSSTKMSECAASIVGCDLSGSRQPMSQSSPSKVPGRSLRKANARRSRFWCQAPLASHWEVILFKINAQLIPQTFPMIWLKPWAELIWYCATEIGIVIWIWVWCFAIQVWRSFVAQEVMTRGDAFWLILDRLRSERRGTSCKSGVLMKSQSVGCRIICCKVFVFSPLSTERIERSRCRISKRAGMNHRDRFLMRDGCELHGETTTLMDLGYSVRFSFSFSFCFCFHFWF